MQIAPKALNVLESFPASQVNSELADYWHESEQKVQAQNHINHLRQVQSNDPSQESSVNSKTESKRRVRASFD